MDAGINYSAGGIPSTILFLAGTFRDLFDMTSPMQRNTQIQLHGISVKTDTSQHFAWLLVPKSGPSQMFGAPFSSLATPPTQDLWSLKLV